MNLSPINQLSLYGHHSEFTNFINLYKKKKPTK
jgi:DNA polymerase-3 subunit delta'